VERELKNVGPARRASEISVLLENGGVELEVGDLPGSAGPQQFENMGWLSATFRMAISFIFAQDGNMPAVRRLSTGRGRAAASNTGLMLLLTADGWQCLQQASCGLIAGMRIPLPRQKGSIEDGIVDQGNEFRGSQQEDIMIFVVGHIMAGGLNGWAPSESLKSLQPFVNPWLPGQWNRRRCLVPILGGNSLLRILLARGFPSRPHPPTSRTSKWLARYSTSIYVP